MIRPYECIRVHTVPAFLIDSNTFTSSHFYGQVIDRRKVDDQECWNLLVRSPWCLFRYAYAVISRMS